MNDERRRHAPPARQTDRRRGYQSSGTENLDDPGPAASGHVRVYLARAIDALYDGEHDLALAALEEADDMLRRLDEGWVMLKDFPLVPDLSVFEEEERGR